MKAFLKTTLASPRRHYWWLCSLSYLEYIGYRKMVKALEYEKVTQEVYHHLSDEIHHSYMLKEIANQIGTFDKNRLEKQIIENSEVYFQGIDQAVDKWVKAEIKEDNHYFCYLLTSYLIEKRAMMVYPAYMTVLKSSQKSVLQKIIKDEREHLSYLEKKLLEIPKLLAFKDSKVWKQEDQYFSQFIQEFDRHVDAA